MTAAPPQPDLRLARLVGRDNYYEDFAPGALYRHQRGKTLTALDNLWLTHATMNTAEAHFNEDMMRTRGFGTVPPGGGILVYGGASFSLVCGLAQQDCCEQALSERAIHSIALKAPVAHGDTLYAVSEVLAKAPDDKRADAGRVTFKHYGINQKDELVLELVREVVLKRRSHWLSEAPKESEA